MKFHRAGLVASLLVGLFLSSCSTFYDARFAPAPLEVRLEDSATGLNGRVLATVVGVRRPSEGAPAQVEVGLRLENLGNVPLQLDAGSLQVTTADLVTLPAGALSPEVPPQLAAGESGEVLVAFPLPAGRSYGGLDFNGLNLRFAVRCGGSSKIVGASFERRPDPWSYRYGPYYPGWGWGGGWGGGLGFGWSRWGTRCPPYVGGFWAY
ncbi:MAG: hypothetical protein NTV21_04135 [Planctomycetota bacterium]|nr:hypothetical protein [Planctomycetota bacterium]